MVSASEEIRNADSLHPWRQDSSFFYFTGLETPGCSLLVFPQKNGKPEEMLFIPPVDPEKEKWSGRMLTRDEARDISGISSVHDSTLFEPMFFRSQKWKEQLYCELNDTLPDGSLTPHHLFLAKVRQRLPGLNMRKLIFLTTPLRVVKQVDEIKLLKSSIEIIQTALDSVFKKVRPGMMEYQVEAELSYHYTFNGSKRHGFDPIVAGGKNGAILHYVENSDILKEGDLLLIDTGCEIGMYSGDVTRTIPVNGRFTGRQKECCQAVLDVNKAFIRELKAGYTWNQLFEMSNRLMTDIYSKAGLIPEGKKHTDVSYHKIGHYLGLDVHDVGRVDEPMKPGTVITVEPGLYLPDEGIGIRIEDNVLLTENGYEILTASIPKEIEDIEAAMAGRG